MSTYTTGVYKDSGGDRLVIASEGNGILDVSGGNDVVIMSNAGAPTNGASGTGAGTAGAGSLCMDRTNAKLYINTNTTASPTWTVVGAQTT